MEMKCLRCGEEKEVDKMGFCRACVEAQKFIDSQTEKMDKLECDGYGCVPARFMFVGISAGQRGALVSKVPLTKDASGRIFQRCLNRLGFSSSDEFSLQPVLKDCFITNLVKSRVLTEKGLNRLPTKREMIDWFPYFRSEVQKVKPQRIVALGYLVGDFLRKTEFRWLTVIVKHPRWYNSHGALNSTSQAFEKMVADYQHALRLGNI